MIKSMTAFGRASLDFPEYTVTAEIRSVNSRFLDCSVRIPQRYRAAEERLKSQIKAAITRAKVDVSVSLKAPTGSSDEPALRVNLPAAEQYIAAARLLSEQLGVENDLTAAELVRLPGMLIPEETPEATDEDCSNISAALSAALSGYSAMRTAEGERLYADLSGKLDTVRSYVDRIETISAGAISGYREKFEARLRSILADTGTAPDPDRVLTECAIYADKAAIDEELVRLRSHFVAFREIAASDEPSGRKLDFLLQEMNRETNTIGSKAQNSEIAHLVVDIKAELEKIREQVQNIE